MRIQHNIAALNSYRNLTTNNNAVSKNLEKLSSGYRINRAGDDAAGLAISEKMRAQITGLETAQKNANDGISLVQTAEGALTEVHSMLNRMVELANQSANGTYADDVDRENLQAEIESLTAEIDRISKATNFNGLNLLDGSMDPDSTETITQIDNGSKQFDIQILQSVATDPTAEVGTKTVLHEEAPVAGQTSFRVDLHNLSVKGEDGDKVEISIGEEKITLDIKTTADATKGELTAGTAYTGQDLADAISKAATAANLTINGQGFTAEAKNGSVTFTQSAAPTIDSQVVDPNMAVTVEYVQADANKAVSYTVAIDSAKVVAGFSITIDGQEIEFDTDADTTLGTDATPKTITGDTGEWKISYDSTAGKLTIKDESGELGTPTVTMPGDKVLQDVNGVPTAETTAVAGAKASGKAEGITLSDGDTILTGVTVDLTTPASPTVTGTHADYDVNVTQNADGTTYDITLTAKADGTAKNGDVALEGGLGTVTLTGGKDAVAASNAKTEYDLSGLSNGDKIKIGDTEYTWNNNLNTTLSAALAAIGTATNSDANLDTVNNKLVLTAKNPGDPAPTATVQKSASGDDEAVSVIPPQGKADPMTGTWNVQTTVNELGGAAGGGQLASTEFTLNDDIVKDGQVLTIGDTSFIFKTDADSTVKAGDGQILVDVSKVAADKQIDEAGAIIANEGTTASKAFTIGYADDGQVSVHEIANQDVYTNGELNTLDGFNALIFGTTASDLEDVKDGINGRKLALQIGDTSDEFNRMELTIKDMSTEALGIGDISIATQADAQAAVNTIKNAINIVSSQRGDLGAIQNRLEHTISNLSVTTENITAAESRIRDVDMAEEMMAYTKNNILVQASQAMLAQANQIPQGVLQLLQ